MIPSASKRTFSPGIFPNTKYKSFQRQLNMWGFERQNATTASTAMTTATQETTKTTTKAAAAAAVAALKGAYLHPCFVRGQPELCRGMVRIKIKGILSKKKKRNSSSSTTVSTCSHRSTSTGSHHSTTTTTTALNAHRAAMALATTSLAGTAGAPSAFV